VTLRDDLFNWKDPHISNWRKLLRIKILHGFTDIDPRGVSAMEFAITLLKKHGKELKEDEKEFVESLLK